MLRELHLGFRSPSWDRIQPVRPLTTKEIEMHERLTPLFAEARDRLRLFHILRLNYDAWEAFIEALGRPEEPSTTPDLVADQLLFNFLAAAYGITEHFRVSYEQRFKKNQAKMDEYKAFLEQLCADSWAFAFFVDFRNYVQHVALPVGRYNRTVGEQGVEFSITYDASTLLENHRNWKRCGLADIHGKIDLIKLSKEYYSSLVGEYGSYVASTFHAELWEVEEFYTALTSEIHKNNPGMRMALFENMRQEGEKYQMTLVDVPNSPLAELGILVKNTDIACRSRF